MNSITASLACLATVSTALAQSPVVGINLRGTDTLFSSTTTNFVANYVAGAPTFSPASIFALDFDAAATTLWAVTDDTSEYGTFDLGTGIFTSLGTATLPLDFTNGLTAHPDGNTWYAVGQNAGDAELWVGDVTTGNFSPVGIIAVGNIIIDIAIDVQGNLFGHSISTDSLYSIDPITGAGTLLGPTSLNANFAQGMDFDWSTGTLWASIYTGSGTGMFCSLDTTNGSILTMEDTTPLNAELEMAVQQPSPTGTPIGSNYCGPAVPNSTGNPGVITATGSELVADNNVTLTAIDLPNNQFGFFINSLNQGFVAGPGGSQGNLCLGAGVGRYNANVFNTGVGGAGALTLDLTNTPTPAGAVSIAAGQSWNFQAWYRDAGGNSNFTDAVSIDFQ